MRPDRAATSSSHVALLRDRYLRLLKLALTRDAFPPRFVALHPYKGTWKYGLNGFVQRALGTRRLALVRKAGQVKPNVRWTTDAETMIGMDRLDDLQRCLEIVLDEHVKGDLLEAGVWRGGAVIFMRAMLEAYSDEERVIWAADSFQGPPVPFDPADSDFDFHRQPAYSASLQEVRENFERYELLDDRVRFLKGWFSDTLPSAGVRELAILRISADLYHSTRAALDALYGRVTEGGFVIVDGYPGVEMVKRAVDDFRAENALTQRIEGQAIDLGRWRR